MKLGDGVKAVTSALGIEQCEPCKERQKTLNSLGDRLSAMFGGKTHAVEVIEVDGPIVIDEVK